MLGGAFNQTLAAIALLIVTCWLASEGRKFGYTLWPSIFLFITCLSAAVVISYQGFVKFFTTPDLPIDLAIGYWVTGCIALLLVVLSIFLSKDAYASITRFVTGGAPAAAVPEGERE